MVAPNKKGYLQGNLNFKIPCHLNYGKCFLDKILEYENKIAMIDGVTDEKITFNDMAHKIMRISTSLTKLGVRRGDVIGICSENRIDMIPTMIGVLCAGGVATFFNPSYSKDEIIHIVSLSKPKFLMLSPSAYQMQYSTLKSLNIIDRFFIYGSEKSDVKSFYELDNDSVNVEDFEPVHFYGRNNRAIILYSSGTTGAPKGVIITHLNWIATIYQDPYTAKPLTLLNVVPFSNTMGCAVNVSEMFLGKTVVFLTKFNEDVYLRTIERYKVGMLLVAPSILVILSKSTSVNKYDVRSLELLVSGGAPLESETIAEFKKRFPSVHYVLQGYGMSEVIPTISKDNVHFHKQGSVGKLVTGSVIKIVDHKTNKTIMSPNQPGEVRVAGPIVFDGYIGVDPEIDDDGFFKTGDIAYYDEDGYIFIKDRIKELIKYKGWQVSPSQLEALLLQHPCLKDAAVVGLPDKLAGELPTAFVVKKSNTVVTEKDIVDFISSKVSPWKRLRGGVRFVDDIPKSPGGKILRRILRESLTNPLSKL